MQRLVDWGKQPGSLLWLVVGLCAITLVAFAVQPPRRSTMPQGLKLVYAALAGAGVVFIAVAPSLGMSRGGMTIATMPGWLNILLRFLADRYGPAPAHKRT